MFPFSSATVAFRGGGVECRAKAASTSGKEERVPASSPSTLPFSKPQPNCPRAQRRFKWSYSGEEAFKIRPYPTKLTSSHSPKKKKKKPRRRRTSSEAGAKQRGKKSKTMAFTRTAVLFALLAGAAAQVRASFGAFGGQIRREKGF